MNEVKSTVIFDSCEHIKAYIKQTFEPVDDKPGYVWFNKINCQIISIETLSKALERQGAIKIYNSPLDKVRNKICIL